MPGHPRLYRRGATYYHRAAIPVDIKDSYPKTEETFSLKTKDYQEALKLVRRAAVEVDERFEIHRKQLQGRASLPVTAELTDAQIRQIGQRYYATLLDEDDDVRLEGFGSEPKQPFLVPEDMDLDELNKLVAERLERKDTFEEREEDLKDIESQIRSDYARGIIPDYVMDEVDEVLSWDGIDIQLDGKSPSRRKLARELQASMIKAYETEGKRNQGEIIETPDIGGSSTHNPAVPFLSSAAEEWMIEKSRGSWAEKTAKEHSVWMNHFIGITGDRPLIEYSKSDGRLFKSILLKLPANWSKIKHLKDLDISRAADKAHHDGMKPMSNSNVNKLLAFIGSFWSWAEVNYDECPANPIKGLKIKVKKQPQEERDPFTLKELQAIFHAPIYSGCKSAHHWKTPGPNVLRDSGLFWVPLISLFTGARSGEIIQLNTEDVSQDEGVWLFHLKKERDEKDKKIKTTSGYRRIPIHKILIDIGLLDHIKLRGKSGDKRLFPDLKIGVDGYYSSPFSKYFKRFLESVDAKHKKNAFHSFRHNFEDACRNSGVTFEVMNTFQGHRQPGMAGRYGSGYSIKVLAEEMAKVRYEGLDLGHLMK